jgi:hypothetical protein
VLALARAVARDGAGQTAIGTSTGARTLAFASHEHASALRSEVEPVLRAETTVAVAPSAPAERRAGAAEAAASAPLAAEPKTRRHAIAGALLPPRIELEPAPIAADAVTGSVTGFDAGAPRRLEIWRVGAGAPQRLARAESDESGRVRAPQIPLPAAGVTLVATPIGARPGEPGASEPQRLERIHGNEEEER